MSRVAQDRLALINQKENLEQDMTNTNLLNVALEEVMFAFAKVGEEEMVLADQLKDILRKTREMLGGNMDPGDPEFISLREELERLFKKKKLTEVSKEEMEINIEDLEVIYNDAKELERKNNLLKAKYENDEKYARLHKRLLEKDPLTDSERKLFEDLQELKKVIDISVLNNARILENESYTAKMMGQNVINTLKSQGFAVNVATVNRINQLLVKEYINEYNGISA